MLLAVSAVMRSYLLTIRGVLQGLELFGRDSAIVILDRLVLFAASAVVLVSRADHSSPLRGRSWPRGSSHFSPRLRSLENARRNELRPSFDFTIWKELQRRAVPLGAFLIVLNLYSYIDTVMLGILSTDVETGLYNAAYRIYEGLTYAPAVLSSVLTPRLSTEFVRDRVRHFGLARQGVLVSLGIAIAMAAREHRVRQLGAANSVWRTVRAGGSGLTDPQRRPD